jgi:hypothetical protein
MPNKVDTLFKELFGIKPKRFEPRPNGQELFKMISQRLSGREVANRCNLNRLFAQQDSASFEVIETLPNPDGMSFLIKQTMSDGNQQFTLHHGEEIKPDNLTQIAQAIPTTEWFTLNDLKHGM